MHTHTHTHTQNQRQPESIFCIELMVLDGKIESIIDGKKRPKKVFTEDN